MRSPRPFALAILLCAVAPLAMPAQERIRNHFDFDKGFGQPGYFDLAVLTGEGKAIWMVLPDPEHNPPSTPNQVTQTEAERPAGSVAAAIRRTYVLKDGTISVAVKRQAGLAGLLLRMAGEKDYRLVLMAQDGSLEVTATRGGVTTSLATGHAAADREWNTLSVVLAGPSLKVLVNGAPALEATDPAPAAGRAGLATQGPGAASFDEFVLDIKE